MEFPEAVIDSSPAEEAAFFWRAEQLVQAGYETTAVFQVAGRRDIDLHLAVDLVTSGCPHDTALQILL